MPARPRRSPLAPCTLAVAAVLLIAGPARAGDFTAACDAALRKPQIDDLVARLRAAGGACRLGSITTDSFRTTVDWRRDDRVHTARVAPRACLSPATLVGPSLALDVPADLGADCPEAHAALTAFAAADHDLAAPPRPAAGWQPEEPRLADPRRVAAVLAILALLLGALALRRRPVPSDTSPVPADSPPLSTPPVHSDRSHARPAPPPAAQPVPKDSPLAHPASAPPVPADSPHLHPSPVPSDASPVPADIPHHERRWWALAAALFALGLAARHAVVPGPANWYGAFLPPEGWGDLRFGPGAAVLQSAARAVLPWTADVAHGLVRLTGALVVPLVVLLVRRLGGTLAAAALAGLLVAFAPIPVRLSASSAEHVLAGTLALGAWVVWLRTASDPSAVPRLLAVVLAALAVLTRADCLPQLAAIPLWTTLAAPTPLAPPSARTPTLLAPARRRRDAAAFLAALAAIGLHAYVDIVLPSHHPGPDAHALFQTAKKLLSQFWTVALAPPHWLPQPALLLSVLGLLAAVALRRWRLLLAVLATLVLVFVPLGRNLVHDGLTGARYFVLLAPLLALAAAAGSAWLATRPAVTPRRAAIGLGLVGLLHLDTSQPGWQHETTFQAEHRLLARVLADPTLAGCTLWYVPPRQPVHEPDLDCCLDPGRSPLVLHAPEIRLRPVPSDLALDDGAGCHLYYEGAICSLDPALAPESPQTASLVRTQCDLLRRHVGERELFRATVTRDTLSPRSPASPTIGLTLRDAR